MQPKNNFSRNHNKTMSISNPELIHGIYEAFRARKLQTEGSTFSDTAKDLPK
jgi:hypothetical protein